MRGREGIGGLVVGLVVLLAAIAIGVWLTGASGGPAGGAAGEEQEAEEPEEAEDPQQEQEEDAQKAAEEQREERLEAEEERREESQEAEEERREEEAEGDDSSGGGGSTGLSDRAGHPSEAGGRSLERVLWLAVYVLLVLAPVAFLVAVPAFEDSDDSFGPSRSASSRSPWWRCRSSSRAGRPRSRRRSASTC